MDESTKKRIFFALEFLLKHLIWILPIFYYLIVGKFSIFLFFVCFIFTLTYWSWKKAKSQNEKKQQYVLVKSSKLVFFIYYASVLLFLFLTMVATYRGMSKVFSLVDGLDKATAILISFGVPLALFGIVLIIKERKTPSLWLIGLTLYILFDGLVALPFNFLFFYDHLTKCERAEQNELVLQNIINKCDSTITPKTKRFIAVCQQFDRIETDKNKKLKDDVDLIKKYSSQGDLNNGEADNWKRKHILRRVNRKSNINEIKVKDSLMFYKSIQASIDTCIKIQHDIENQSDLDKRIKLINRSSDTIRATCRKSLQPHLQASVKQLQIQKESSIQSIKHFYEWIYQLFKNGGEKDMPVIMSISISAVIDILPLFLSFLFIAYKRND